MKTTTILEAYEWARAKADYYQQYGAEKIFLHRDRQAEKFRSALLIRIEAGDRAREALRQVEWTPGNLDDVCPWCCGLLNFGGHESDCPRQLALGIEP